MNDIYSIKKVNFFTVIFLLSILSVGIFYEFLSCVFSLTIIAGLFVCVKNTGMLKIDINIVSISVFVISTAYLVTAFWAIDPGMAVIGFFKFIPVALFLLAICQEKQTVRQIYTGLPYVSAFMVPVSFLFMQIPSLEEYFSVAGRLAGFLQYPNTFALLLLVSELLLINKEKLKKFDYIICIVLLAGIILSGSRTVFVLMIASNIVMILILAKRKKHFKLAAIVLAAIVVIFAAVGLLGGAYLTDRLLQISSSESTFTGRLLYFQDAMPVILQHPLGLGYMGHYYLQQSIQTGLYSVRYIHNDFLQLALDVGWVPCLLFIAGVIKSLFSKRLELYKKIILIVICLHASFDFDLQFISMFCLMITFMDVHVEKKVISIKTNAAKVILIVMAVLNLYMGIALTANAMNKPEFSHKLYPWNTQNEISRILQTSDVNTQEKIADGIIKRNEYVVLAYSVKARNAYLEGNYTDLILWKHKIFEIAPFQYDEYEDYCYKLIDGIELYAQIADMNSINVCKEELLLTQYTLKNLESKLSDSGKKIKDQPETELPADIKKYIDQMGGHDE